MEFLKNPTLLKYLLIAIIAFGFLEGVTHFQYDLALALLAFYALESGDPVPVKFFAIFGAVDIIFEIIFLSVENKRIMDPDCSDFSNTDNKNLCNTRKAGYVMVAFNLCIKALACPMAWFIFPTLDGSSAGGVKSSGTAPAPVIASAPVSGDYNASASTMPSQPGV